MTHFANPEADLRRPSYVRRRGFTLLELFISISILLTISVMLVPQFNRYRSTQHANQAAHELAADLRRLSADAIKNENYMYLEIGGSSVYYLYRGETTPGNNVAFKPYPTKSKRDISGEYGRASISPTTGRIAFGPGGWVATDTTGSIYTTITRSGTTSDVPFEITVSCGIAEGTYKVQVYANGRVVVTNG